MTTDTISTTDLAMPPTRRTHETEARDDIRRALDRMSPTDQAIVRSQLEAIVERRVRARAGERHRVRVQYARAICEAAYCIHSGFGTLPDGEEPRRAAAAAIALLALLGQGGPGDAGGPGAASQLPLLPHDPRIWWHKRRIGGAWCAALADVAFGHDLIVTVGDGGAWISVIDPSGDEVLTPWDSDQPTPVSREMRCAIARLLDNVIARADEAFASPSAEEVDGVTLRLVTGAPTRVGFRVRLDEWPAKKLLLEAIVCSLRAARRGV